MSNCASISRLPSTPSWEQEPAIKLFEKFRFRHDKTRTVNGKELMYFYLDLYTGSLPKPPSRKTAALSEAQISAAKQLNFPRN